MSKKNCVAGMLAGGFVTLIAMGTFYFDGVIWSLLWIAGPVLILLNFLYLMEHRNSESGCPVRDPALASKPFMIKTETFELKLQMLSEKYPDFFKARILNILTDAHRGLEKESEFETSVFEEENPEKLILQIRMRKLDSGTTSLVLRGKTELIDLLSSEVGKSSIGESSRRLPVSEECQ